MASEKISELTELAVPRATDWLVIVDRSVDPIETKKAQIQNIAIVALPNVIPLIITGPTTLDSSHYVLLCDTTDAPFTVTLPPVAEHLGRPYEIKNIGSTGNAVTVDGDGDETIDDGATAIISTRNASITIVGHITGWYII